MVRDTARPSFCAQHGIADTLQENLTMLGLFNHSGSRSRDTRVRYGLVAFFHCADSVVQGIPCASAEAAGRSIQLVPPAARAGLSRRRGLRHQHWDVQETDARPDRMASNPARRLRKAASAAKRPDPASPRLWSSGRSLVTADSVCCRRIRSNIRAGVIVQTARVAMKRDLNIALISDS